MSVLQKCFGWICAALVCTSATQPCPAATLTMFSLDRLMWFLGVPHSDPTVTPVRVLNAGISDADWPRLSSHDVVLIIDKSYSMAKTDCLPVPADTQVDSSYFQDQSTAPVSRWQWCHDQTRDLTEKTQGSMPAGITIVLFSGDCEVFNNVNASTIETIFSNYTPKGATNTTAALKSQLDQYFERRGRLGPDTKPLLIAVITDGCPDEPFKLRRAIIDATLHMTKTDEISITFLQVGDDSGGSRLLKELDSSLVAQKAKFDIVDVTPFAEMRRIGLAHALLNEVAKR